MFYNRNDWLGDPHFTNLVPTLYVCGGVPESRFPTLHIEISELPNSLSHSCEKRICPPNPEWINGPSHPEVIGMSNSSIVS